MKKHTKLYLDAMGYDPGDWVPCEACGAQAVDIHHIEARGMGGGRGKDDIDNLQALCRSCHEKFGDKKQYKEYLKGCHLIAKQRRAGSG